ncbi:hypothetical protein ABK040_015559 [Willaertia magna]
MDWAAFILRVMLLLVTLQGSAQEIIHRRVTAKLATANDNKSRNMVASSSDDSLSTTRVTDDRVYKRGLMKKPLDALQYFSEILQHGRFIATLLFFIGILYDESAGARQNERIIVHIALPGMLFYGTMYLLLVPFTSPPFMNLISKYTNNRHKNVETTEQEQPQRVVRDEREEAETVERSRTIVVAQVIMTLNIISTVNETMKRGDFKVGFLGVFGGLLFWFPFIYFQQRQYYHNQFQKQLEARRQQVLSTNAWAINDNRSRQPIMEKPLSERRTVNM